MDDEQQPVGPDDAWAPPPAVPTPPPPPPPAPPTGGPAGGLLPPASSPTWPPGRAAASDGATPGVPPALAWDVPATSVPLPSGPPSPWSMGGAGDRPVAPSWVAGAPSAPAPVDKGRRSRRLAAVAAVAVLAVGGIGAALALRRSGPATHSSPESAVASFLGALQDRDVLGAAETLPKAERTLIVDVLGDLRDAKVDDAPSDASLHAFDAYTLTIDGLTTNTEVITESIAVVELTGGTYEATGDAKKLPFGIGKMVSDMAADEPDMQTSETVTGDIADLDSPVRLTTVRDTDGWHVSLFYSVAESARVDAGMPTPDPAARIAAAGAATPEGALREMIDAASAGRWERMIELTPPDEMAALHDYGALMLDDAPASPAEPWFTITRLDVDAKDVRGGKLLQPTAIGVEIPVGDGGTITFAVEQAGDGCYHVTATAPDEDPYDETQCAKDGFNASDQALDLTPEQRAQLESLTQMAGVVVVPVDGQWYVSPARTIGRLAPTMLTALQFGLRAIDTLGGDGSFQSDSSFGSDGSFSTFPPCESDGLDPSSDTSSGSIGGGIGSSSDDPFCMPPTTTGS